MTAPTDTAPVAATPAAAAAAPTAPRTFLFSWGMYADPVFDRDVETFNRSFSAAYGAPAEAELFGFTSPPPDGPDD